MIHRWLVVFVSDTPFPDGPDHLADVLSQSGVGIYDFPGQAGTPSTITMNAGQHGRYVRVQLKDSNYMEIAEAQIFGVNSCSQSGSAAASRLGKSNTGGLSPQVSCAIGTPTPTPDVQPIIDELATYGITVYAQGSNPSQDPNKTQGIPWQVSELQQVLAGVQKTAQKFKLYSAHTTDDQKAIFRRIMDDFFLLHVQNGYINMTVLRHLVLQVRWIATKLDGCHRARIQRT